ncbi:THAP domain-containing protein 2-like [Aphis craccivora]|uniref:THAP domain-containing protein 2-like n=1 Tax=Aphis craccivora TaxID=307492 RepID=A0A6G0Z1H7_APHCR|nr:THAP domain-containing protein 2-like [Aphis craccivora]
MGFGCLMCKKPTYIRYKKFQASFHSFPKCPIQKKIWIKKCKLTTISPFKYPKLCSFHFELGCFKENTKTRILKPDAIPTIFVRRFMKKKLFEDGILKESLT